MAVLGLPVFDLVFFAAVEDRFAPAAAEPGLFGAHLAPLHYLITDIYWWAAMIQGREKKEKQFADIELFKLILTNMHKKLPDPEHKEFLADILQKWDKKPSFAINAVMENQALRPILEALISEFWSWKEAYDEVVRTVRPFEWSATLNVVEELKKMQQAINMVPNGSQTMQQLIHRSYYTHIVIMSNKNTAKDQAIKNRNKELIEKWTEIKRRRVEDKLRKVKEKEEQQRKKEPTKDKPQSGPAAPTEEQRAKEDEKKKKEEELQKSNRRLKQLNEERIKLLKEVSEANLKNRLNNMVRYMEGRRDFTFTSREEVAKELEQKMMGFMGLVMQKVIHAAKLKHHNFSGEDAGDEFRLYSSNNKSLLEKEKFTELLPITEQKILKVRYPCKLEQYTRLRMEEERREEDYMNEMRKKLESDKKSDKFVQGYVLGEQSEDRKVEAYEADQHVHRSDRLTIHQQSVQYVIQADEWFSDQFVMEKTFYKLKIKNLS